MIKLILKFSNQPFDDQQFEQHLHPNLQAVDLQNCSQLGDQTLTHLALKTRLYSLRWISNPKATSSGHFFFATNAKLQNLNVSGCEQFTDEACAQHLQSPTLQYLDVSFCNKLTDQAFAKITAPLLFLNIQGCSHLSDHTLENIHSIKTLKYLFIGFNDQFSKSALEKLKILPLETLKIYPLDI